jgi:TonB family protein
MSRFFDALQRSQAERSGVEVSTLLDPTELKEGLEQEDGLEWEVALKGHGKNIAQVYSEYIGPPCAPQLQESAEPEATLRRETALGELDKSTAQIDSGNKEAPGATELVESESVKLEAVLKWATALRSLDNTEQIDSANDEPANPAILASADLASADLASADVHTPPIITWPTPGLITYGTKLTFTQLNATATVEGTFVYAPEPGHLLPAGTHTLGVTFTPAGSGDYAPQQATVSIVVAKATPALSWPTPAGIIFGTALGDAQLNASASQPGRFDYFPASGDVLLPGMHTLSVTFTPGDSANCAAAQASVSLTVARATSVIRWPTPDPIRYGTPLTAKQLCAVASIPGTFEYDPGLGAVLAVGEHKLSVVFTPADTLGYSTSQTATTVTVARATSVIQWPTPEPITYGTKLSAAQLCAVASVPGTFEYDPGLGAVLAAGEHRLSVVFTPADALGYSTSQTAATLTVSRATFVIQWPPPDPITYGTELSAAQLRAVASVPGTFEYEPGLGAVLAAGEHKLSVVFTPADALGHSASQTTASLTVAKATPAITWPTPDPIAYGAAISATQLNAAATVQGSFVYSPAVGEMLKPEVHELSVTFTPVDTLNYTRARAVVALTVTGKLPTATLRREPHEALIQPFSPKRVEVKKEQKTAKKNWMTVAVVSACAILLPLILIIPMFHHGTKSEATPSVQPIPVLADTQPTTDPSASTPEPFTQDKPPAMANKRQKTNNHSTSNEEETTPAQLQTIMMNDQVTAPTRIPKQEAENTPPPAGFDTGGADGLGGGSTNAGIFNGHGQSVVKVTSYKPIVVSSGVATGMLTQSPPPLYPSLAKTAHVAGTVELRATIATNGTIKDLRAVSGPVMLRQAAVDAVRNWRYRPYRLNNQPVEVQTTVNVVFTLGG